MCVIVFLLNCKISDVLQEINGAQVGHTLKNIYADQKSCRDIAYNAEKKAKANSLINVRFPTLKEHYSLGLPLVCMETKLLPNSNLFQRNIKY